MNYEPIKFWTDIFQMVIIAIIGIQNYLFKRQTATVSAINRIEQKTDSRLDEYGIRLTTLESEIKHCPTHEDLGKIYDKLNELSGEFKEMLGEFKHVTSSLGRLYQNELDKHK